jgi:hypothetical protein
LVCGFSCRLAVTAAEHTGDRDSHLNTHSKLFHESIISGPRTERDSFTRGHPVNLYTMLTRFDSRAKLALV